MTRIITIFFLGLILTSNCIAQTNTKNSIAIQKNKNTDLMQGLWFHDQDSLATITIKDYLWNFNYKGEQAKPNDSYSITLTDKLSKNETSRNLEYIILTNKTDTLQYEILGITDTTFGLMYVPAGKFHLYRRHK